MIEKDFKSQEDRIRWCACKMSDGNFEAVSWFVQGRNQTREREEKGLYK